MRNNFHKARNKEYIYRRYRIKYNVITCHAFYNEKHNLKSKQCVILYIEISRNNEQNYRRSKTRCKETRRKKNEHEKSYNWRIHTRIGLACVIVPLFLRQLLPLPAIADYLDHLLKWLKRLRIFVLRNFSMVRLNQNLYVI